MTALYYSSVREYLVEPSERRGIVFAREERPPTERLEAAAPLCDLREAAVEKLRDFYARDGNFERLQAILSLQSRKRGDPQAPVSLRILEFLCTDNGLALEEDPNFRAITDEYQHMLKAHSKAFFDIFARGERFDFRVGEQSLQTTLGQLQFFRWAIERGLLDKVEREKDRLRAEARLQRALRIANKEPTKHAGGKRLREHQLVARVRFGGPFTLQQP